MNEGRSEGWGKAVSHAAVGDGDVAAMVHSNVTARVLGAGGGDNGSRAKRVGPVYKGNSYVRKQTTKNIVTYFAAGVWGRLETVMLVPGNC